MVSHKFDNSDNYKAYLFSEVEFVILNSGLSNVFNPTGDEAIKLEKMNIFILE
jgi:hypothetical protein